MTTNTLTIREIVNKIQATSLCDTARWLRIKQASDLTIQNDNLPSEAAFLASVKTVIANYRKCNKSKRLYPEKNEE